ncbi:geranylgeranylglycerol-phosphate geranylgeranyltransferase [bacterium]|nr:geranylgeranylglycerol-phosphate geranylgeranyltransferase [bacterium]
MNKLLAHIKILRPLNCTIGAFTVIITASILKQMSQVSVWLTALYVVVCYNAAANAINDYFDIETDRINRPNRPLVSGDVKQQTALFLAIALFIIGTVWATTLLFAATIIAVAIALPLMIFYSIWFKGMPLVGNLIIALILGLTFLFAGAALNDMQKMIIPAILAFGLTAVRELVKDISDVEGDRKVNLKTFPIIAGVEKAWWLASVFAIIIGIGAILPFIMGKYNYWYIIFVLFGVEIPLVITVFSTMKSPTIITAKRVAQLLKFSTIAGVFAVWLGSI